MASGVLNVILFLLPYFNSHAAESVNCFIHLIVDEVISRALLQRQFNNQVKSYLLIAEAFEQDCTCDPVDSCIKGLTIVDVADCGDGTAGWQFDFHVEEKTI